MCSRSVLFVVITLCLSSSLSAQSPYDVNSPPPAGFHRGEAQQDAETHLANLIRLDTQNPPGNERQAAEYFESVLSGIPGIETHILDMGQGRANFVARLRAADPTKGADLVMGHSLTWNSRKSLASSRLDFSLRCSDPARPRRSRAEILSGG